MSMEETDEQCLSGLGLEIPHRKIWDWFFSFPQSPEDFDFTLIYNKSILASVLKKVKKKTRTKVMRIVFIVRVIILIFRKNSKMYAFFKSSNL